MYARSPTQQIWYLGCPAIRDGSRHTICSDLQQTTAVQNNAPGTKNAQGLLNSAHTKGRKSLSVERFANCRQSVINTTSFAAANRLTRLTWMLHLEFASLLSPYFSHRYYTFRLRYPRTCALRHACHLEAPIEDPWSGHASRDAAKAMSSLRLPSNHSQGRMTTC